MLFLAQASYITFAASTFLTDIRYLLVVFVYNSENAALQVLMSVRLSVRGQLVILPIPRFPKVTKGYPRISKVNVCGNLCNGI